MRLTGADVPVAVQVPIRGKFCHSVGVFAGLVADLLLKTFRNLARVFLKLLIALSKLGHINQNTRSSIIHLNVTFK